MRAVRYHDHGGPEVLNLEEVPRPDPTANELLVRVEAAAVNPVDTYFREGSYPSSNLPWTPGSDVAGVVEVAGEESDFTKGDRVFATGLGNSNQGTCAEYVLVPSNLITPLPDAVSFDVAAAGALVGVTAWQSLIAVGDLSPGEHALVHGGNGGVGHIAIQLASTMGADVTTTASPEYHDRLTELGADVVIDYTDDDLANTIKDVGKPDVILDHRLDEYLGLDCQVASFGARIAAIGNKDSEATFPSVPTARAKALTLYHVGVFNTPDLVSVLRRLARLFERGHIDPVVARSYELDEVADAQTAVLNESFLGKFIVTP